MFRFIRNLHTTIAPKPATKSTIAANITVDDINFSKPVWCYSSADGNYAVYHGRSKNDRVFLNVTKGVGWKNNRNGVGCTQRPVHPKLCEIAKGDYDHYKN